jgi:hypothetical protein
MIAPDFINFLTFFAQPVNFFAHLVIFLGAFYILLHNKHMPRWHVTPLWWAGCASLFTFFTIVMGLFFGDDFVFSYSRFGYVGEVAFNTCIASVALVFLVRTLKADLQRKKQAKPKISYAKKKR